MFVYQVESSLWHCSIYFLPHCFSLHLQRLRAILAIQFSSEGVHGVHFFSQSVVCLCGGQLIHRFGPCVMTDDWWKLPTDWTGLVRGKWCPGVAGAQPLWDQGPSYFIRQMCFSGDSRVNGTGLSCQDRCRISGGYVRGLPFFRPFIHPSLLIPGQATRRETSGGDTCPQWGRLVLKVLMEGRKKSY